MPRVGGRGHPCAAAGNAEQKNVLIHQTHHIFNASRRAGGTHVMHGRSRMTIDSRVPTTPGGGERRAFTDPADIDCLHSASGCWVSRMKGELPPTVVRIRTAVRHGGEGEGVLVFFLP